MQDLVVMAVMIGVVKLPSREESCISICDSSDNCEFSPDASASSRVQSTLSSDEKSVSRRQQRKTELPESSSPLHFAFSFVFGLIT